jgi:outer membrane protein assembly factor BamE (lipoprotein component of BamABCDE complex)
MKKIQLLAFVLSALLVFTSGCNRNVLTGSKLTLANYDLVSNGMTKAQVERIMGPPTSTETKDMLVFKRTTYRYEEGTKFAMFTFKNDELDSKDGNLAVQR